MIITINLKAKERWPYVALYVLKSLTINQGHQKFTDKGLDFKQLIFLPIRGS